MQLGTARFRGGRSDEAMAAFRAAAQIAREIDDAELLAAAAVGFEEACWRPGITDEGAVELLEEASAALGERRLGAARQAAGRAQPGARVHRPLRGELDRRARRDRHGAASR